MDVVENVLQHFGIVGMKWGVRRARSSGGAGPSQHHTEDSAAVRKTISTINKHGVGAASNHDLKMLEQRIKLEMKYNELFPKQKSMAEKGFEIAKRVLIPVAEQQAKNYLNTKIGDVIKGPAPQHKSPAATPSQVQSVLNLSGHHTIANKPKLNFGFVP